MCALMNQTTTTTTCVVTHGQLHRDDESLRRWHRIIHLDSSRCRRTGGLSPDATGCSPRKGRRGTVVLVLLLAAFHRCGDCRSNSSASGDASARRVCNLNSLLGVRQGSWTISNVVLCRIPAPCLKKACRLNVGCCCWWWWWCSFMLLAFVVGSITALCCDKL